MKRIALFIVLILFLSSCGQDRTMEIRQWFLLPNSFDCDITVGGESFSAKCEYDGADCLTLSIEDFNGICLIKTLKSSGVTSEQGGISVCDDYGSEPLCMLRRAFIAFSGEDFEGDDEFVASSGGEVYLLKFDFESVKPSYISASDGLYTVEAIFK